MSDANIGKRVTWKPRAYHTEHAGVVVAFVPAGAYLRDAERRAVATRKLVDAMDDSTVDRYLVRVDREGSRGQKLAPRWYAPHASIIDAAIAAEEDGRATVVRAAVAMVVEALQAMRTTGWDGTAKRLAGSSVEEHSTLRDLAEDARARLKHRVLSADTYQLTRIEAAIYALGMLLAALPEEGRKP